MRLNTVLAAMKLSRAECCGIIAVENAFMAKNDACNSWNFSANSFRAIYAPRWTLEPIWGGSSLFEYKDTFFEIADEQPDIDILVRPHPLMFDHFVEEGLWFLYSLQCLPSGYYRKRSVHGTIPMDDDFIIGIHPDV